MTTPIRPLLALGLASCLVFALACDKGPAPDKSAEAAGDKAPDAAAAKADDKAADAAAAKADDAHAGHGDAAAKPSKVAQVDAGARVEVLVDAGGYTPAEIQAPPKTKITLAFKRTTEQGCGQELVIKTMELEKDLPLDEVVEIEVEVPESGELGFACGMDMYKGKVVPKA